MECKKCGAKLQLEHKFCPYCGEVNQEAAQHAAQMEYYQQDYSQTQRKVLRNSTWFSEYFGLMLGLIMVLLLNVICIIMVQNGTGYRMASDKIEEEGELKENREYMESLIADGEHVKLRVLSNEGWSMGGYQSEWHYVHICCEAWLQVKNATLYRRGMAVSPYYTSAGRYSLESISQEICDLYKDIERGQANGIKEVREYIASLQEEAEIFMQVYLYLTPEDMVQIRTMNEEAICKMLQEREQAYEAEQ